MRCNRLILVLLVVVGLGSVLALAADTKVAAEQVRQLIAQLGSDQFTEREAATKALEEIGPAAYEALQKAIDSPDAEVQRRAKDLLQKIERRVEAEKVLAPTRVHLVCKDVPVAEAVADLAKKSGYPIVLGGDQSKLVERRVTLDTGATTFWQAFDQLCQKASLVEADGQQAPGNIGIRPAPVPLLPRAVPGAQPLPVVPPQKEQKKEDFRQENQDFREDSAAVESPQKDAAPAPAEEVPAQKRRARQVQAVPAQIQLAPGLLPVGKAPAGVPASGPIVLVDGKPPVVPTCYAGALRIRALPSEAPKAANETGLTLEVRAEPKIHWRQLENLRIDKAVDDLGQELLQVLAEAAPPANNNVPIAVAAARANLGGIPAAAPGRQQLPVRLKKAEKPSRALKELKGTLTAQVQTAAQALMTVDNILKAAGQTVKGKSGGAITVHEFTKQDNGQYKLRVQLEAPPEAMAGGPLNGVIVGGGAQVIQIQIGGNALINNRLAGGGIENLALLDAKGQKFQQTAVSQKMQLANNVIVREYTLLYQPQKDQGVPDKLVFSGTRTLSVDVPFALNDVPLP